MRLKFRARQRALAENRREDARTNVEVLRRGIRESYADVRELLLYIEVIGKATGESAAAFAAI